MVRHTKLKQIKANKAEYERRKAIKRREKKDLPYTKKSPTLKMTRSYLSYLSSKSLLSTEPRRLVLCILCDHPKQDKQFVHSLGCLVNSEQEALFLTFLPRSVIRWFNHLPSVQCEQSHKSYTILFSQLTNFTLCLVAPSSLFFASNGVNLEDRKSVV